MKKTLIALTLAFALPLCALAGPIEPGRPLPALRLKNQHDQEWLIPANTRLVVFAAGRKASNLVMAVLGQQHQGFLASRHAVYLADMSQMPGLITRTFALPALREQPFEVGVSLDETLLAGWPRQEDAVTLIGLDAGRVTHYQYASSEAQLRTALGLPP
jgi:hypothetical protein